MARTLVVFVMLMVLLYPLSVGPVLAHYRETGAPEWCAIYRPLFRNVPSSVIGWYLNIWGISDIEAFFMLCSAQDSVHGD